MISTMLLELPGSTYDNHQSAAVSYFNGFVVQTQLLDTTVVRTSNVRGSTTDYDVRLKEAVVDTTQVVHSRDVQTSTTRSMLKETSPTLVERVNLYGVGLKEVVVETSRELDVGTMPHTEFGELDVSEVEVTSSRLEPEPEAVLRETTSSDVDLTSLNWLHNLNIMSVPSLPTPPISPAPTTHVKYKPPSPKPPPEPELPPIDYSRDASKPPFSYAQLICTAMAANNNRMTLSTIYQWIRDNFLYYQLADPSWQNSIRHNLSLNKHFVKVPRSKDEPGKGGFWKVEIDQSADTFNRGVKKRKMPPRRVRHRRSKNFPLQPSLVEKQTLADVDVIHATPVVVVNNNDEDDLASMFLSEENWDESQLELLDSILNTL